MRFQIPNWEEEEKKSTQGQFLLCGKFQTDFKVRRTALVMLHSVRVVNYRYVRVYANLQLVDVQIVCINRSNTLKQYVSTDCHIKLSRSQV